MVLLTVEGGAITAYGIGEPTLYICIVYLMGLTGLAI